MRCWICGVEPDEVYDIHVMESAQAVRQVPKWPAGDHRHSETPPSPEDLLAEANWMMEERIRNFAL
jgi:hypothetical protein